jgi:hypothetical protein
VVGGVRRPGPSRGPTRMPKDSEQPPPAARACSIERVRGQPAGRRNQAGRPAEPSRRAPQAGPVRPPLPSRRRRLRAGRAAASESRPSTPPPHRRGAAPAPPRPPPRGKKSGAGRIRRPAGGDASEPAGRPASGAHRAGRPANHSRPAAGADAAVSDGAGGAGADAGAAGAVVRDRAGAGAGAAGAT